MSTRKCHTNAAPPQPSVAKLCSMGSVLKEEELVALQANKEKLRSLANILLVNRENLPKDQSVLDMLKSNWGTFFAESLVEKVKEVLPGNKDGQVAALKQIFGFYRDLLLKNEKYLLRLAQHLLENATDIPKEFQGRSVYDTLKTSRDYFEIFLNEKAKEVFPNMPDKRKLAIQQISDFYDRSSAQDFLENNSQYFRKTILHPFETSSPTPKIL